MSQIIDRCDRDITLGVDILMKSIPRQRREHRYFLKKIEGIFYLLFTVLTLADLFPG